MEPTITRRAAYRVWDGDLGFWIHESRVCNAPMRFSIFHPNPEEKLPVLYWLSGLTCSDENFMMKAAAFRAACEHNVVLVVPDTSPRETGIEGEDRAWDLGSGAGFYVNATQAPWSQHYRMYDYVRDELPQVIESNFNVTTRRSIFGHSMGGHGALILALRNPDKYMSVSAFAPICAPTQCAWGEKAFLNYLGEDPSSWRAYDACALMADSLWDKEILVDQGTSDSFIDEQLRPNLLIKAAQQAGKSLNLRIREGFDHSYYFIQSFIDEHIAFHAKAFNG